MAPRVLVTEPIHEIGVELLRREADLVYLPDRPGETVDQHLPSAEGVVVRIASMTAERLARAERLRAIGKHGVGVDNIDLAAAKERGIVVVSTPGANDEAVAEHALMMILILARQVERAQRLIRAGQFDEARRTVRGTDLAGKTLGLVGLGRIGSRLARSCQASFGMRVLAYDPYVTPERAAELGVEKIDDLTTVLSAADVVSIHTPLTSATRNLIGAGELAQMKSTALLINCARGGLIDEIALARAVEDGTIAGAGVDAFVDEPPARDNPLLDHERIVVTPHIAGGSEDALRRMAQMVAEDVLGILRGAPPRHPVD